MELGDRTTIEVQIELDKLNATANLYDLYFFDDPAVYMPDMSVPERWPACNARRQQILNQFIAARSALHDLNGFASVSRDLTVGQPVMPSQTDFIIYESDFRASLLWGMYGNPCFRGKQFMAWEAESTSRLEAKLQVYRGLAKGYPDADLSLACVARILHLEFLIQQRWRARATPGADTPPTNGQPLATNGHPPPNGHPPTMNGHPPPNGHPPTMNGHPPPNGHPRTMNGHPPSTNGHPAATRRHGRTANEHPAANSGGPNGTHRMFSGAGNAESRDMSSQTRAVTPIFGENTFADSAVQDQHATRSAGDERTETIRQMIKETASTLTGKRFDWSQGTAKRVGQPRRYRRDELISLSTTGLDGRTKNLYENECARLKTQSGITDYIIMQEAKSSVGCWKTQTSDNCRLSSTHTDERRVRGPRYQFERNESRYQPFFMNISTHPAPSGRFESDLVGNHSAWIPTQHSRENNLQSAASPFTARMSRADLPPLIPDVEPAGWRGGYPMSTHQAPRGRIESDLVGNYSALIPTQHSRENYLGTAASLLTARTSRADLPPLIPDVEPTGRRGGYPIASASRAYPFTARTSRADLPLLIPDVEPAGRRGGYPIASSSRDKEQPEDAGMPKSCVGTDQANVLSTMLQQIAAGLSEKPWHIRGNTAERT